MTDIDIHTLDPKNCDCYICLQPMQPSNETDNATNQETIFRYFFDPQNEEYLDTPLRLACMYIRTLFPS